LHCLNNGPHWIHDLAISSHLTTVISVNIESLNHDNISTWVPISAWTCAKIFILSLVINDFHFPLLSIFHPFAMKFVLFHNKIWSLWSEVTWAQKNLTWVHSCWMFHSWKHSAVAVSCNGQFLAHRHVKDTLPWLSYSYTDTQED
jgi:hypothetical protein